MSTASEIDRMPASCTRRASQRGLGRVGSMPVTVSATNSEQASDASSTGKPSATARGTGRSTGSRKADPGRLRRLPGQAADGQAVAAVRSDRDVEDVIA